MRIEVYMKIGLVITLLVLISGLALATTKIYIKTDGPIDLEDSNVYLTLGNVMYGKGLQKEASMLFKRALELDPDNSEALNNLAVYYSSKDEGVAENYFTKAINADFKNEEARMGLAVMLHSQKRYDEAIGLLKELVDLDAKNPSYHYDLGINIADMCREKGICNLPSAINSFKKAEELSPNYLYAKQNIQALTRIHNTLDI